MTETLIRLLTSVDALQGKEFKILNHSLLPNIINYLWCFDYPAKNSGRISVYQAFHKALLPIS